MLLCSNGSWFMCITTNSRVTGYEGPDKVLRLCDNKNSCIPVSWLS